uniref:Uncharacterized protein n=1 Tax=Arundo donax TaxID=35708 RepID=A0A0A9C4R0_ARUDO
MILLSTLNWKSVNHPHWFLFQTNHCLNWLSCRFVALNWMFCLVPVFWCTRITFIFIILKEYSMKA